MKITKWSFLFVLPTLILSCGIFTKEVQPEPDLSIYLLLGQSNMAGRGIITSKYKEMGNPNVLMFDKEMNWVIAEHPLHFDKPKVVGVGPGLSFGMEMIKTYPNKTIGLVPCAVGGTRINKWTEGAYDKATDTHPWDDAVIRIKEAMKSGKVEGLIWHQGEGDSTPERAEVYLENLSDLIARVRKLTGEPNLPVVVGELGQYRDKYRYINLELTKLSLHVKHAVVVSSAGLTHKGDETHFSSDSAHEFGIRMAKAMIDISEN